ncbi:MAG: SUMF1/EgtB/PvdO family nonheme iron enzyme [Planctomycetota bacterium]
MSANRAVAWSRRWASSPGRGPADQRRSLRVLRGGAWNNESTNLRCGIRNRNEPRNRNTNIGFRCASDLRRVRPAERPDTARSSRTRRQRLGGPRPTLRVASGRPKREAPRRDE